MNSKIIINIKSFFFTPLKHSNRNIIYALIFAPIGTLFHSCCIVNSKISNISAFFYNLAFFELIIYSVYFILLFPLLFIFQIILKHLKIYCIFTSAISYILVTLLAAAFFTTNHDFSQKFLLILSFTIPTFFFYALFSFYIHTKNTHPHLLSTDPAS